jgi:hypothetical protein
LQLIHNTGIGLLVAVMAKKRSASAALLSLSSEDEPDEVGDRHAASDRNTVAYQPPRQRPPLVSTLTNPNASLEVEIVDILEADRSGNSRIGNEVNDGDENDKDDDDVIFVDEEDDDDDDEDDDDDDDGTSDAGEVLTNTDGRKLRSLGSTEKVNRPSELKKKMLDTILVDAGVAALEQDVGEEAPGKRSRVEVHDEVRISGAASGAPSGLDDVTSDDGDDGEIEEFDVVAGDSDFMPDAAVVRAVSDGGKDVEQHNARYFMMENVVCSHCGVKGHMSFDCPEEADERRCFLCGKPGHDSKSCPDEACFYCGSAGHRQRDCPTKLVDRKRGALGPRPRHIKFDRAARKLSPPRQTLLFCYVCGGHGHVDCSLAKQSTAALSCCNCGQVGHALSGCPEPTAERWISYVNDLQRERRASAGRIDGASNSGGRRAVRSESRNCGQRESGAVQDPAAEAQRFREEMCRAVRSIRSDVFAATGRKWRERTGILRR